MFVFALKNMAVKKIQIILVVLSIVISAGVGVLAYNVAEQVSDGITGTAGYYSAIIGPAGSKTQLAMNTLYFTDAPLGTIPYAVVSELKQDMRVKEVIPFAMADSYNGSSLVGTTPAFLAGKSLASGRMFEEHEVYEVVVGSSVAKVNRLKVGDSIYTSHSVGETHTQPFTVVGILEETHTIYDNVVFTEYQTIWAVHEHGDEHGDEEHDEEHDEEEHDHEEMDGMVCAILVKTANPAFAMTLVSDYNSRIYTAADGDSFQLQAIEPMETVRGILDETNTTKYIVYILCAVILVMNLMIVSVVTLLNMINSAKEIRLMRLIGISMMKINLLYTIQNGMIGFVSIALSLGLSRLCLNFMQSYVINMGVVLNMSKVYPTEFIILLGIFAISVLPTVVMTCIMSRKSNINE